MNRKVLVVADDDGMVALVTDALGGEDELTFASGEGQAIPTSC